MVRCLQLQNNEGAIRKAMVEADVVDCMVALPPQLFFNTQIPACIWFLTRNKRSHRRDRSGETLFIDARKLGQMETRVNRVFDDQNIAKIANAYHAWRQDSETVEEYKDIPGFCFAAKIEEIRKKNHILTPKPYVGSEAEEEDDETFNEKMLRLTTQLTEQFQENAKLETEIRNNLGRLGYEV